MNNYNEFDEPPRNGLGFLGNVGPKAAFLIVLIALSFMIGVVWKLYVGGDTQQGQDVPIVRASENPFKVEPDEPGGMEIPHKDSTIFSSLNNENENRIENLLAEDNNEDPMPRSQLFAGLNTEETPLDDESGTGVEDDRQTIEQMTEEAEEIVEGIIEDGAESVMPPPPKAIREGEVDDSTTESVMTLEDNPPVVAITKPEVAVQIQTEPAPIVAPAPTPLKKVKVKPTPVQSKPAAGEYYVQLGSVKTAEGAKNEWKKIVAKYPSILSGYDHRVETADLGTKGRFYRIQAGPVSKEAAVKACEAIKKIDANGCLLKKK